MVSIGAPSDASLTSTTEFSLGYAMAQPAPSGVTVRSASAAGSVTARAVPRARPVRLYSRTGPGGPNQPCATKTDFGPATMPFGDANPSRSTTRCPLADVGAAVIKPPTMIKPAVIKLPTRRQLMASALPPLPAMRLLSLRCSRWLVNEERQKPADRRRSYLRDQR